MPFLVQFKTDDVVSHINGICTIILALYTPYLLYNKKTHHFTFHNNLLWAVAYTFILGSFYAFNSYYRDSKYIKLIIILLFMPTAYSMLIRDTELWIPLRVYSLALTCMIVSSKKLTDVFTGTTLDKTLQKMTNKNYSILRSCSVAVNVVIVLWLMKQGTDHTLLGYLLNM